MIHSGPRILVVTGKGGVGKSTIAAAIGLRAASLGLRTLIIEISGSQRMADIFDVDRVGYTPTRLRERLWAIGITSEAAIEEYVVRQIKFRRLYRLVFRNRVMMPFVDAVPGLHDAVQLGKVYDLEQETGPDGLPIWDLLIVDAPATGHGLTMLNSARSMMELTRSGPVYEGVRHVHDVIDNPDITGFVLVSLPEEMPVSETLDLWERLGPTRGQTRVCVLNQVFPAPLDDAADWAMGRTALLDLGRPDVDEAVDLTDQWLARIDRQDHCREQLQDSLPVPIIDVPFMFHTPPSDANLLSLGRRITRSMAGFDGRLATEEVHP